MADFHDDFGQRNGHCSFLQLAHPGVQLILCQKLLKPLQGLHVVGHDENHTGFLVGQRHVKDKQFVLFVLMEAIKTCTVAKVSVRLFVVDMMVISYHPL